jgi:hypothetical protein
MNINRTQLDILIEKHKHLDVEADQLSQKRFLTPVESKRLWSVKRAKLRLKDEIEALKQAQESER